jgi:hypothetical protein
VAHDQVAELPTTAPARIHHPSQWPVYLTVAVVAVGAMAAVAIVATRATNESTPISVSVFGFASMLVLALLNTLQTRQVGVQVEQVEAKAAATDVKVDGMLAKFLELTAAAALARGHLEGAASQRDIAAADTLARAAALALTTPPQPVAVTVIPGETIPVAIRDEAAGDDTTHGRKS